MTGNEKIDQHVAAHKDMPEFLIIHSTADYVLPYSGGRGLMTMTTEKADASRPYIQAQFWARVHGAGDKQAEASRTFDKTTYSKDGETKVVEYLIKGGHHAWDGSGTGGFPLIGRPLIKGHFDTSKVVWEFLHDKPIERRLK